MTTSTDGIFDAPKSFTRANRNGEERPAIPLGMSSAKTTITSVRDALYAKRVTLTLSFVRRFVPLSIMASIQAIEQSSVHQIQSGQVIVDLNSVVKELVENSLDAGSTSIEVRFRNHGLDAIEVIDNGTGIAPEDFNSVGK